MKLNALEFALMNNPIRSAMPQHPLSDPRDNRGAIHPQRRVWPAVEPIAPQMAPVRFPHRGSCILTRSLR